MLRAGLTGSIAVGKTFVCGVFRELGCHVLDADLIARDVVRPGTPGLAGIVSEFGGDILMADGSLDRGKLGEIVFASDQKRQLLNSIVHPLVIEAQDRWLREQEAEDPDGIAIIDAALMIESGAYRRFDTLIVVWCEPAVQLERLMRRDNLSAEEAARRIAVQMPQEEKKRFAGHLIDTSGGTQEARRQAIETFERLRVSR